MGGRRTTPVIHKKTLRERLPAWLGKRLVGAVILGSLLVSGMGFTAWFAAQPDTLPIKRVKVEGEFRYLAEQDVYQALGELTSGGFFNVDVRAVKQVAESLQWIDKASVRRIWPSTLQIDITEQVPLARWGKDRVINIRGEVFHPPAQGLSDTLPVFYGPDGTAEKVAKQYQLISGQLASVGLEIEELRLSERRAWDLRLRNGLKLVLGRPESKERLGRFIAAYPGVLKEKITRMQSIDLRYTNGFAVSWKPEKESSTG
ncbi:cell division protein FtsQ/DivIB [Kaarinaea lacus]